MGLPVVATDVPGCRNIVEDGHNGLLCEVKSSASLQQAMQKIMAMTGEERATMGENGRVLVSENYGEHLVIEATMRAVESAVQSKQAT
jgi:glycosyltransferase involved in cell wall biosynthesis